MKLLTIYKELRINSKGVVRLFKADWRIDRNMLRRHYVDDKFKKQFIHVANPTNTHLWFIYTENLDTSQKHLFGHSTPREIMKNVAGIFTAKSFPDGVIQHFDGNSLRVITHDIATSVLEKAADKNDRTVVGYST